MKALNKKFIIFSILLSLCILKVNALSYTSQEIFHPNSEFPKVCVLDDGNLIAISSEVNGKSTYVAKLDRDGRFLYQNSVIPNCFSEDSHIVQPANSDYYLVTYHDKLTSKNVQSKENIYTFKDKNNVIKTIVRKNGVYQKTSVVSLKNGNVIIAGIGPKSGFGAEAQTDINIYNPNNLSPGTGFSFKGHSDYISCFEQKQNEVFCAYVSYEDVFVTKLKIKKIIVNGNTLSDGGDQVVKNLYTSFNFLKAIRFNDEESLILFQVGDGKDKLGQKGGNLFFYQLKLDSSPFLVTVKRYELLYENCLFDKDNHDPEHQNADIAVLSSNYIYAVCETSLNKFRGFLIYPDREIKEKVEEFNFNNFDAEDVKSPTFAKFGQSLGLFYTHITPNKNKRVAFQIMNYPDCYDFVNEPFLAPIGFSKTVGFGGKAFINNPYQASKASDEVKIRFKKFVNLTVTNYSDKSAIKVNTDYNPSLTLKFQPLEVAGIYSIEYTATREDEYDGLIIGKTCKVNFYTPKCLDGCVSCTETGRVNGSHYCLGCKEGYYEEPDPNVERGDFGKPHNCKACNVSCSQCYGDFYLKPYPPTTNCKENKCNFAENFFPFEDDERTCISNDTKKYWEEVYGTAIYLDKSAGVYRNTSWVWRRCHENCAECFEKGDDVNNKCFRCKKGLYFFCNQTLQSGIPGSCYRDCENNGFYVTVKEDREKCCPCFENCKVCKNDTKCDKCYPPFLLTPPHDSCNLSCGYCLAEDRSLGECVNCKTRYKTPKYKLNKTCVDEIPFIESIKRYHHIVDDTCNLLHGCKEGCHKCSPWYSDKCTECSSNYYKEDLFNKTRKPNDTFLCFNKTTCQGITPYKYDIFLRIGGVPVFENNELVCLNCKLRNNSYRLPEDDFYCGPKIPRTYVDIDEYNKLSYCYFRCKSCDYWGNAMFMNCSSCRDGDLYELLKIGKYGNCYRKKHKCGIYPYYHDYDLAEVLGKDEDHCGEDCDVCLYNMTCTEKYPFFVYETHECIDFCPIYDVLNNVCSANQQGGMILLKNPLGLKNPYDFFNTSVNINQVINSEFVKYILESYDVDQSTIKKDITNYVGNGQIYNLPESKIIIGNNISIELSTVRLELEKLAKLLNGEKPKYDNSILDLSSCQSILKKKYGLPEGEDLFLLKGDTLEKLSETFLGNKVNYQLFSTSLGAFLPLNDCKEAGVSSTVTNFLNTTLLKNMLQFKTAGQIESGYNIFDMNSPFFHDICTPFTNEYGNDVLLDERRTDYFSKEHNFCEKDCEFIGYNENVTRYTCKCPIRDPYLNESGEGYKETPMVIPDEFYKKEIGYSNIRIFKCASQVFSAKGQKKNFGSYALMLCFVSFVAMVILYRIKGTELMEAEFKNLSNYPKQKNNSKPVNPEKDNYDDFINKDNTIPANPPKPKGNEPDNVAPKVKNVQKDVVYNDEELNSVDYNTAVDKDRRSFIQYYWSLLKLKQLCIFTFYTNTDHNLRCVKVVLFVLFLSFYFAFTALFFNDKIIREIYIYKGNTDAAVHVTNIILSSLCTYIMSFIIRFVSLSERNIMAIKRENDPENRDHKIAKILQVLKIKIIVLFVISGLLISLCWYYVSAFCAVFKNSQANYFINTLVAFIVCNIWPCVTSLIAPIFRLKSLNNGSECMYKFSQIIAYF